MIISRVRQRRVAERVQVSEQEVKNFLASDLGKMQLSEELHLANILVSTPDSASSQAIQAAAAQAQDIYRQLKQGADFAQLAIAKSGSDNALEGGDMAGTTATAVRSDVEQHASGRYHRTSPRTRWFHYPQGAGKAWRRDPDA